MEQSDVIIIGAGGVGCAIARELSRYRLRVTVLEKECDVAAGTTGRNSAVVHAGFNNKPGSLMAKLCVEGNKGFEQVCKDLDIPFRNTGKVLAAFDEEDLQILKTIMAQGEQNGCEDLRLVDADELKRLVPGIDGIGGMVSPHTSIFDPFTYCIALAENAAVNGVQFCFDTEVTAIETMKGQTPDCFLIRTNREEYTCSVLINSAGVYADRISAMAGVGGYRIYPCRGEYFILDKVADELLTVPVYPAPKPGIGGLGVHLTPTIDGNIIIGPSAEYLDDPEDYACTQEVMEKLLAEAKMLLPAIDRKTVIGNYAGIRAKQTAPGEGGYRDFVIKEEESCPGLINLIGIESPGLTASVPIARMVRDLVGARLDLAEKGNFIAERKGPVRFRDLSEERQAELIREDPEYGEIVCRCQNVTKHEIREAIENPLGVRSLSAIKYRAWATTGRCNGGYCLTRIVEMLRREYGMKPEEITYRGMGSEMFSGSVHTAPDCAEEKTVSREDQLEQLNALGGETPGITEQCDVLIIGAGPGGLAAAKGAKEAGAGRVIILERDTVAGGILNQCIHDGFGLIRYKQQLTGPEYALRAAAEAKEAGAELWLDHQVVRMTDEKEVIAFSSSGMKRIRAGAVILATGCRERTRGAISIPGSRPAGVFTAGVVQNFVNIRDIMPGRRVVILGSGDVGMIMARRLTLEGAKVEAVVEVLPEPAGLSRNVSQCLYDYGIPIYCSHTVSKVIGKKKLTAVEISEVDEQMKPVRGTEQIIACDALVLSVGLIPENEVAGSAGVKLDTRSNGALTDPYLQTNVSGIFSCGNARRIMDLADFVSEQGELAGRNAAAYLRGAQMKPWDESRTSSMIKGYPVPGTVTCTLCPNGCQVRWNGETFEGNRCKRGAAFATQEQTAPRRMVTSTVKMTNGRLLPVRTEKAVPKEEVFFVMEQLQQITVDGPLRCGDEILRYTDAAGEETVIVSATDAPDVVC